MRRPRWKPRKRWNKAACWSPRSARPRCRKAGRGCASRSARRIRTSTSTACSTRWLPCRNRPARAAPYNVESLHRLVPMSIVNLAAYRFVALDDLPALRERVLERATALALKGTVLLAPEGINLFLAGPREAVDAFMAWLRADARFAGMEAKESLSDDVPFGRLRVRLKKEIITMHRSTIRPEGGRAPAELGRTFRGNGGETIPLRRRAVRPTARAAEEGNHHHAPVDDPPRRRPRAG